ncbi:hypothetical protein ON010_g15654 [Phytophthora cinnamomi]|nr:hypothetical protein ON010_g15654 [Phytophthora cinnamomi]
MLEMPSFWTPDGKYLGKSAVRRSGLVVRKSFSELCLTSIVIARGGGGGFAIRVVGAVRKRNAGDLGLAEVVWLESATDEARNSANIGSRGVGNSEMSAVNAHHSAFMSCHQPFGLSVQSAMGRPRTTGTGKKP